MGQAGSDVAKDASDIILTDDNFASILAAVEEGRRTFDNIQKFVLHLLAQNIAQALTLLIGLVFKDSEDISVFPLAPVEILWIIMITSGIPDMGLGFEVAEPNIMQRPPQSLKAGIFTMQIMIDMLCYGIWTAALCITAFVLVLYGFGDGTIGTNCNDSIDNGCELIFRARATCFATLTWFSLFLAWEVVDMRRSFFRMQPDSDKYFTQWFWDVWRNKFLFFAVCFGFTMMFPLLYIPVINDVVFKHTGISWEWAIVFIEAFLFFCGCEVSYIAPCFEELSLTFKTVLQVHQAPRVAQACHEAGYGGFRGSGGQSVLSLLLRLGQREREGQREEQQQREGIIRGHALMCVLRAYEPASISAYAVHFKFSFFFLECHLIHTPKRT